MKKVLLLLSDIQDYETGDPLDTSILKGKIIRDVEDDDAEQIILHLEDEE